MLSNKWNSLQCISDQPQKYEEDELRHEVNPLNPKTKNSKTWRDWFSSEILLCTLKELLFSSMLEPTARFFFTVSIQEQFTLKHVLRFVNEHLTLLCTNSNCCANNHRTMLRTMLWPCLAYWESCSPWGQATGSMCTAVSLDNREYDRKDKSSFWKLRRIQDDLQSCYSTEVEPLHHLHNGKIIWE